jgi:hypothetical protein
MPLDAAIKILQDRAELFSKTLSEVEKVDENDCLELCAKVELVSLLHKANSEQSALISDKIQSIEKQLFSLSKLPLQEAFLGFWQNQAEQFLDIIELKQLSELFSYYETPEIQNYLKSYQRYHLALFESRDDIAAQAAEDCIAANLVAKNWFQETVETAQNLKKEFPIFLPCTTEVLVTWLKCRIEKPVQESNAVLQDDDLVDKDLLGGSQLNEDQSV